MSNFRILFIVVAGLFTSGFAGAETPAAELVLKWGTPGEGPGEFHSPIGIAISSRNKVFITDLNNARVQAFSDTGEFLSEFPLPRDNPDRKSTMIGGIAIDPDHEDLLYLTFMVQHKIGVYRATGELVREWGKQGSGPHEFHQPGGVLIAADGNLLICDQCNHRIVKYTREGTYLTEWGGWGTEKGQFDGLGTRGSRFGGPHLIAQGSQGRFYTTEGIQGRVQQFSASGDWLAQWGDKGDQPGGFGDYKFGNLPLGMGPIGIAVDRHDHVFVSSLNSRVQVFDTTGIYLFGISDTGMADDPLDHPHGMAFDSAGFLYVCDAGSQRVLKFKLRD